MRYNVQQRVVAGDHTAPSSHDAGGSSEQPHSNHSTHNHHPLSCISSMVDLHLPSQKIAAGWRAAECVCWRVCWRVCAENVWWQVTTRRHHPMTLGVPRRSRPAITALTTTTTRHPPRRLRSPRRCVSRSTSNPPTGMEERERESCRLTASVCVCVIERERGRARASERERAREEREEDKRETKQTDRLRQTDRDSVCV